MLELFWSFGLSSDYAQHRCGEAVSLMALASLLACWKDVFLYVKLRLQHWWKDRILAMLTFTDWTMQATDLSELAAPPMARLYALQGM